MHSAGSSSPKLGRSGTGILLGLAAMLLAGCGGATPAPASTAPSAAAPAKPGAGTAAKPSGSPIKLGILDDVSGVPAIEGALMRINADLVIDQINSTGGVNGHPVQPVYVDPKGDTAQALQFATQLAQQDKVDVLLGGLLSPECLGVQNLAPKLGIVYLPAGGCANQEYSAQFCNKDAFRIAPAGKQTTNPSTEYEVKAFGNKWGILYPDYAFGQSTLKNVDAALKGAGAELVVKIAVPLGETNMTPYVTKIPTDGSIKGLVLSETGTDLARAVSVMQQFGITKKLAVVTQLGKEQFAGVYPAGLDGAIVTGYHQSEAAPDNQWDQAYDKAFLDMAKKDSFILGALGGLDHVTPGTTNGYSVYATFTALKLAMRAASFSGKADTGKLISALENLSAPQGPDFPAGPFIMNKADHQGRLTYYIMKINGQKEEILQTFPADKLPLIGDCQVK